MDDLIKRLREGRTTGSNLRWTVTDIHREAAAALAEAQAEIARLRGALTYIGLYAGTSVLNANGAAQMAREAALRSAHDEG